MGQKALMNALQDRYRSSIILPKLPETATGISLNYVA